MCLAFYEEQNHRTGGFLCYVPLRYVRLAAVRCDPSPSFTVDSCVWVGRVYAKKTPSTGWSAALATGVMSCSSCMTELAMNRFSVSLHCSAIQWSNSPTSGTERHLALCGAAFLAGWQTPLAARSCLAYVHDFHLQRLYWNVVRLRCWGTRWVIGNGPPDRWVG